jgi:cytidyltransferase-like protein
MFKNGIIIGSFQPFHNGHKELIEYALTQVETVHIFFHDKDEKVGINKFWSTSENLHQIRELFADRLNRFTFNSISKPKYNEKAWIEKLGSIFKVIESPIIFTADEDATVSHLKYEYNIPYFKYNSPVDMSSERLRKAFLNNVPRKEMLQNIITLTEMGIDVGRVTPLIRVKSPRQQAIADGKRWYIPYEPCKHCNTIAERYVANGKCRNCGR